MNDAPKDVEVKPKKSHLLRNIFLIVPPIILIFLAIYPFIVTKEAKTSDEQIGNYILLFLGIFSFWSLFIFINILSKLLNFKFFRILFKVGVTIFVLLAIWIGGLKQLSPILPTTIEGNYMGSGKYADKSWHFVCKVCKDINRGDVIDYRTFSQNNFEIENIGRVVGLPGENISLEKEIVKINNLPLTENYADWSEWSGDYKKEFTLNSDECLILLDKRVPTQKEDYIQSHRVKKSNIVGKFIYKLWPISQDN